MEDQMSQLVGDGEVLACIRVIATDPDLGPLTISHQHSGDIRLIKNGAYHGDSVPSRDIECVPGRFYPGRRPGLLGGFLINLPTLQEWNG